MNYFENLFEELFKSGLIVENAVDEETVEKLESGGTIRAYRAMQVIDGKLYPPMSAKIGTRFREPTVIGVWEQSVEAPELIKGNKFSLNKGNKSSISARYNPYFHLSLSPLNDQFSSAYVRPNLVTVEVEVPKSELASGYRAMHAKDMVGEVDWHSGPVSSKLAAIGKPRKVILSRFCKAIRIVPDNEIAKHIRELIGGHDIKIPDNVVTPSLKHELMKLGISIAPRNKYFK